MFLEIGIYLGEGTGSEEAAPGGEGGWMGGGNDHMAGFIDQVALLLGMVAPENEDDVGVVGGGGLDQGLGKLLPAKMCV